MATSGIRWHLDAYRLKRGWTEAQVEQFLNQRIYDCPGDIWRAAVAIKAAAMREGTDAGAKVHEAVLGASLQICRDPFHRYVMRCDGVLRDAETVAEYLGLGRRPNAQPRAAAIHSSQADGP